MPKITCESVPRISIKYLREHGGLAELSKKGCNGYSRIEIFEQKKNGTQGDLLCTIELVTTPCPFGGRRFWFICPKCKKRVSVLYKHYKNIWCRTCNNLTYISQLRTHIGQSGMLNDLFLKDWEEEAAKIRVKYCKGKPTRRYQRLLNREKKYNAKSADLMRKIIEESSNQ